MQGRLVFDITKLQTISQYDQLEDEIEIKDPYENKNLSGQLSQNNLYYLKTACSILREKLFNGMWLTNNVIQCLIKNLPLEVLSQAIVESNLGCKTANRFVKKYRSKFLQKY